MTDEHIPYSEREIIETCFSIRFCLAVEQAIKHKFPNIKGLSAEMNEHGTCSLMFEEGEYTEKEVTDFLAEFRKNGHKQ